jgi:hypothetical protein
MIMETTIDPVEWRREVDRVQNLLEIPEYPELLLSGSDSSYVNPANFLNEEIDISKKLNFFSGYFDKILKNKNLQIVKSLEEGIDYELNKINSFENFFSSSNLIKDKIDKIQKNNKTLKICEKDITIYSEKVNSSQNKLDDLEENLRVFNVKIILIKLFFNFIYYRKKKIISKKT